MKFIPIYNQALCKLLSQANIESNNKLFDIDDHSSHNFIENDILPPGLELSQTNTKKHKQLLKAQTREKLINKFFFTNKLLPTLET